MVDPDAGETPTDNRFVAVTRGQVGYDVLPDLDIGRLPANSAAEVTAMVNKILAYEAQVPAAWMKQVLFVTGDLEGGGGNYDYSNGIADGYTTYQGGQVKILPQAYTPGKVYPARRATWRILRPRSVPGANHQPDQQRLADGQLCGPRGQDLLGFGAPV